MEDEADIERRRDIIKKGISHPCVYADVINKAQKVKSDISKPAKFLKNLCRKGNYVHSYIYISFRIILLISILYLITTI